MALICKSTRPASTRVASARFMRARISRCRAARALPPRRLPRTTRATKPPDGGSSELISPWKISDALLRLLVEPPPQQSHVAHIGPKQHVEGVARERHQSDHAINRDVAEHARRHVPGRAKRARLAHQPQRKSGCHDIADHG